MSISVNKVSAWDKIVNSQKLYFRILMVALLVFTGAFFAHNISVQADDSQIKYGEWNTENDQQYYYMEIRAYEPTVGFKILDTQGEEVNYSINAEKTWIKISKPKSGNNQVKFVGSKESIQSMNLVKKADGIEDKLYLFRVDDDEGGFFIHYYRGSLNWTYFFDLGNNSYSGIYLYKRQLENYEGGLFGFPAGRVLKEGDDYYYYIWHEFCSNSRASVGCLDSEGNELETDSNIFYTKIKLNNIVRNDVNNRVLFFDNSSGATSQCLDIIGYPKKGSSTMWKRLYPCQPSPGRIIYVNQGYTVNGNAEYQTIFEECSCSLYDINTFRIFRLLDDTDYHISKEINIDIFNCSDANYLQENVSMYRVIIIDGEERWIKLPFSGMSSFSGPDRYNYYRATWSDGIYYVESNQNIFAKYVCEIADDSGLVAYNRNGTSCQIGSTETDYFNINTSDNAVGLGFNCIAKKPDCKVLNVNDNGRDITSSKYFIDNYETSVNAYLSYREYGRIDTLHVYSWINPTVSVQNKNQNYLPPSDSDMSMADYGGSGDVTVHFKPFRRRIWVGSENVSPWVNNGLSGMYALKIRGSTDGITDVTNESDFAKGAWYYDYYESVVDGANTNSAVTNSTIPIQMIGTRNYDFSPNGVKVNNDSSIPVSLSYAAADNGHNIGGEGDPAVPDKNCASFLFTPSSGESVLKVSGQRYTSYKNTFRYQNAAYRLCDLIKINGQTDGIDDQGNYVRTWTVASMNTSYEITPKNSYLLQNGSFKFSLDGEAMQKAEILNNENKFNLNLQGNGDKYHTVSFDGIKAIRNVSFNSGEGVTITDSASNEFVQAGERYSCEGVIMDLSSNALNEAVIPYQVKIKVDDDRKEFVSGDIASLIKGASSNGKIKECVADRSADGKEITLTLKLQHDYNDVNYNFVIPNDIFEYRKSNVRFDIDMTAITNVNYYNKVVKGISIQDVRTGNFVNLTLISGHVKTYDALNDVPYNKMKYKMTLDPAVIDLRALNLSLDYNSDSGNEVKIQKNSKGEIVFELDPSCEGKNYRENVTFYFKADNVMTGKEFDLCTNVALYEEGLDSEGGNTRIAVAEYEDITETVYVPINGSNSFLAQYTDYSQTFNLENIEVYDEDGTPIGESGNTLYRSGRTTVELENVGFNTVKITVTDSDTESNGTGKDIARIACVPPIPSSPPIKFNSIDGVKYYNVTDSGKIDLNSPIQGSLNGIKKQDFSFAAQCDSGYDSSTLVLKANRNEFVTGDGSQYFQRVDVNDENGQYSVFTIKGEKMIYSYVIGGNVNIRQLTIGFVKDLGNDFGTCEYVYNGSNVNQNVSVLYGETISFEVILPAKCNQSDVKAVFSKDDGGEELTLEKVNGKYFMNNIVSSGKISIKRDSLKINQYPITFKSNDKAYYKTQDGGNLSGKVNVEHNGDYSFRVYANTGYTLDGAAVSLKYSDGMTTTLEPDGNGIYSIQHITQPCSISVENVEDLVYTVTLEPVLGVTYLNGSDNVIKDSTQVKHGHNFEFAVSLDDAYDDSKSGMNIIVNGGKSSKSSAQKLASGRYVINNVIEDVTIKVGNVKKNTYTVTLTGAEGIDYYDASGKTITGDNSVEHHSDFSFKVELYPAYADSNITVMLGDTPMSADGNGFYTISKISESKTVTVVGIEQSDETELINAINLLPDNLSNLGDVDDVIAATKQYEALSDEKKALVGNADKLKALQEQVRAFHHVSNDVKIDGVDWYIKLYAIPITEDVDACGRIYKKLNNEYILSLYNVYLWNTLEDVRYTLPEGQSAVITLPTPDMTYFEQPTAIHERDTGKVDFINLSISGNVSEFQTDSFSPMGIIANRSLTPGRSSLFDAKDFNSDAISKFAASVFGSDTKKVYDKSSSDLSSSDNDDISGVDSDDVTGNIDEKFRSRNNRVTATGSALRLLLVLMVLLLIASLIVFFVRRRNNETE